MILVGAILNKGMSRAELGCNEINRPVERLLIYEIRRSLDE